MNILSQHDNRQNKGNRKIEESKPSYARNKNAKGINVYKRLPPHVYAPLTENERARNKARTAQAYSTVNIIVSQRQR